MRKKGGGNSCWEALVKQSDQTRFRQRLRAVFLKFLLVEDLRVRCAPTRPLTVPPNGKRRERVEAFLGRGAAGVSLRCNRLAFTGSEAPALVADGRTGQGRQGRLGIAHGLGRVRTAGRKEGGKTENLLLAVRPDKGLGVTVSVFALVRLPQSAVIRVMAARRDDLHVVVVVLRAVRVHQRGVGRVHLRDVHSVSRAQGKLGVIRRPVKEGVPHALEPILQVRTEGLGHGAFAKEKLRP